MAQIVDFDWGPEEPELDEEFWAQLLADLGDSDLWPPPTPDVRDVRPSASLSCPNRVEAAGEPSGGNSEASSALVASD